MKSWMYLWTSLALALALPLGAAVANEEDDAAREYFTDLELVDQNGEKHRFYSDVLKDRVVLINVIFTNCQDACPLITQVVKRTRAELAETITDDVWFVSISTDPERDDPEALKAFAEEQGVDDARWLFLTGSKENIDHILKKIRRYNPNINAHSTQMLAGTTRERHEWLPVAPGLQPEAIAALLRGLAEPRPEVKATTEEQSG